MLRQLRRLFKYSLLFLILFFLINYSLNIPNNLIKLNWISKNRPRSIEELETEARLNHYLSRINSALVGSEEINQRLTDISNLIVEDVSKEHPNLVFTEKEIKKMNLLLAAAKKGGSSSAISPPHANSGRLKFPPEPPVVPEISTTKLQNKREKSPSVTSAPKSSYSSLKPSDVILENENSPDKNQFSSIIPTIVFACNRDTVSRSLDKLLISRSHFINNRNLPIIVSQDTCDHQGTKDMILKYVKENENVYYLEQTDRSDPAPELNIKSKRFQLGYFKLARHYKSGINSIFNNFAGVTQNEYSNTELKNVSPNHVIIMEDDLEVSEDFYTFMIAGSQILDANPNLYCVSAWNDNGKPDFIDNSPKANFKMHYSDFFSGLGWILKKNIWEEWESKWPKAYWDDWVRLPEQRLNRACLRPEVSRTYTFGKKGVSNGQFFEKHLRVDFSVKQLWYLYNLSRPNIDSIKNIKKSLPPP